MLTNFKSKIFVLKKVVESKITKVSCGCPAIYMLAVESNGNVMIIAASVVTKEGGGINRNIPLIHGIFLLLNFYVIINFLFLNVVFHICGFVKKAKKGSFEFRFVR